MAVMGGNGLVTGTDNDDTLWGMGGDDTLMGMGGNDLLEGGGGADKIDGGAGNDTASYKNSSEAVHVDLAAGPVRGNADSKVYGGDAEGDTLVGIENVYGSDYGSDILMGSGRGNLIIGWGGDDTIDGGSGNDSLHGGMGADEVKGGDGRDSLWGNDGSDNLMGGAGNDAIDGGMGSDVLKGEGGHDVLIGMADGDMLDGGAGNDTLSGGAGMDDLMGGADNDMLVGGAGADSLDGGAGNDTAWYAGSAMGVEVDLQKGTAKKGDAEGDTLANIENVRGSHMADKLTAKTYTKDTSATDTTQITDMSKGSSLYGNQGNDTLMGGGGKDVLGGGKGNDMLKAGGGNDMLKGGMGDDTLEGEAGNDNLMGGAGKDDLKGGDGADTLIGGAGADKLNGGANPTDDSGTTTVNEFMPDVVSYAGSPEAIKFDLDATGQRKKLSGGDAEGDTFTAGTIEKWVGSDHDDKFSGNKASGATDTVIFDGGKGNDTIEGGTAPADMLMGGAGEDMFMSTVTEGSGTGGDTLNGGDGIDTVSYKSVAGASGVTVDLSAVDNAETTDTDESLGNGSGNDTLVKIENVIGNDGTSGTANSITGSDSANELTGGKGGDVLRGKKGDDMLVGGEGNDTLGGVGTGDSPVNEDGNDTLMGGDGNDSFWAGKGNDRIYTGKGNSTIDTGTGADVVVLDADSTDGRTTTVNDFMVGTDKIDVSKLLDLESEELASIISSATRSGTFSEGFQFTLNLTEYEGGTLTLNTGANAGLSVDDFTGLS